jgi:acyl dehydratase
MTIRWEELVEGCEPAPSSFGPVTVTDIVRYQGASGDMNPIHHDQAFARASGFEQPLGIGMLHAGLMNSWASNWLGPQNVRRTRIRWRSPVFPGDVLTFSGQIVRRYEEDTERRVEIALFGRNQDDRVVVQGWMHFVVP